MNSEVNRYFGEAWNQTIFAEHEQAPTPAGEPCLHCAEPIDDGDQGMLIPQPVHLECLLRMVLGSIGHQQQRCSCYGGDEDDPPGMTRREAARAAVEYYEQRFRE